MPETFNIQVRIGNRLVTLSGAESFQITEGSVPPKVQPRAPIGGKKVFDHASEHIRVIVHSASVEPLDQTDLSRLDGLKPEGNQP